MPHPTGGLGIGNHIAVEIYFSRAWSSEWIFRVSIYQSRRQDRHMAQHLRQLFIDINKTAALAQQAPANRVHGFLGVAPLGRGVIL